MSFVVTKEYNGMINREMNWYHRISDDIDEASHKPMLL